MAFSLYAQCDVGRSASIPPDPDPEPTVKFFPGIYTKIMDFMLDSNALLPTTTFVDSDTTSVWGQLNRNTWMRGIMWTVGWGEIETSEGVYEWDTLDYVLNKVGDPDSDINIYKISQRASAQNKKVLFLLDVKTFNPDPATVDAMLPGYLQATGGTYAANGMTRYHRLIAFEQVQPQTGATTQGYHLDWQVFRNGLSGNDRANQPIYTLRNQFQAFLTALNNRYKDHPAFAGVVLTEPIPVGSNIVLASEYNRNFFFDGRLQWLKNCKSIFTQHPIIEMPTFDNSYMQEMTNNNAADGCVVNRLGIGGPNFHNGTNLQSIINARNYAAGKVIVCNQCQGLDMDTKTGYYTRPNTTQNPAPNDVFNFPSNPTQIIENPNFNAQGQLISQDVPDFQHIMDKAIWLKTNILIYQYDTGDTTSRATNTGVRGNRYNWEDFSADMNGTKGTNYISPNTGASVKNDPAGGMVTTVPTQFV